MAFPPRRGRFIRGRKRLPFVGKPSPGYQPFSPLWADYQPGAKAPPPRRGRFAKDWRRLPFGGSVAIPGQGTSPGGRAHFFWLAAEEEATLYCASRRTPGLRRIARDGAWAGYAPSATVFPVLKDSSAARTTRRLLMASAWCCERSWSS